MDELAKAIDLPRLLQRFFDQADGLAEAVAGALTAGDAAAIGKTAHRFKGPALSMGAMRLGELCQRIEQLGKAGDIVAAAPLIAGLQAMTTTSCQWLKEYLETPK